MSAEITVSKEDYLKAIIEAESEGRAVIPSLLAQWLDVSAPAVTKAVRRLEDDGYIAPRAEGVLKLTDKGREAAHRTALRHHLVERMLAEMFGMEWHEVHLEAERLEHVISPAFEAKLIAKLGKDGNCPHGNLVLPETGEQMRQRGLLPLAEAQEGESYLVVSLYERDSRLLSYLHKLGIGPATAVRVIEKNYDDTLRIVTTGGEKVLGLGAAEKVWVKQSRDNPKQQLDRNLG